MHMHRRNSPRTPAFVTHDASDTPQAAGGATDAKYDNSSTTADFSSSKGATLTSGGGQPPAEAKAFAEYKRSDGAELNALYRKTKAQLTQTKADIKVLVHAVNSAKHRIDELSAALGTKRAAREQSGQASVSADGVRIIDEEEYEFLQQSQAAKRQYREFFAQHTSLNAEIVPLRQAVMLHKRNLCNSFLDWYQDSFNVSIRDNGGAGAATQQQQQQQQQATLSSSDGDVLDDGEAFDKMEMERVMASNPNALSFYKAQKRTQRLQQRQRGQLSPRKRFVASPSKVL
jgi:kinesin family protein 6/9